MNTTPAEVTPLFWLEPGSNVTDTDGERWIIHSLRDRLGVQVVLAKITDPNTAAGYARPWELEPADQLVA